MPSEHHFVYAPLVLDQRLSLPRSRLYHLEPIGIGSPLTESFTSYLARLAHAHRVGLWSLIKKEILPVTKQKHHTGAQTCLGDHRGSGLNGVGSLARRWVATVGQLTGRQDLHWLTMLPWEQVLSYQILVRSERAWCPRCLGEWRKTARGCYEPLLWALQCVSVCSIHEEPLQSRCPYRDCGRRLPLFPSSLLPGRCSSCFRWLDQQTERSRASHQGQDQMDQAQAVRAAKAIGDLLAAGPTLHALLGRERVAQALRSVCQAVAQGNWSAMARLAGLPNAVVRYWMHGRGLPRLSSLVQLCDRIGTTPLALLRDGGHTPGLLRIRPGKASQPSRVGRQRLRRFPVATVRAALEAVLADRQNSPPSVKQVATQLGYYPENLWRRFPGLCRAISSRHRQDQATRSKKRIEALLADVRLATCTLVQQGIYPGIRQVECYLMKPAMFRNPKVREAWRMALEELGVTRAQPGGRGPNLTWK